MSQEKQKCPHEDVKFLRDDYDRDVAIYVCQTCNVWLGKPIPD